MAIKEHIGYPDHILQETNLKLDQEYAHVSKSWVWVHFHAGRKPEYVTDPRCVLFPAEF